MGQSSIGNKRELNSTYAGSVQCVCPRPSSVETTIQSRVSIVLPLCFVSVPKFFSVSRASIAPLRTCCEWTRRACGRRPPCRSPPRSRSRCRRPARSVSRAAPARCSCSQNGVSWNVHLQRKCAFEAVLERGDLCLEIGGAEGERVVDEEEVVLAIRRGRDQRPAVHLAHEVPDRGTVLARDEAEIGEEGRPLPKG